MYLSPIEHLVLDIYPKISNCLNANLISDGCWVYPSNPGEITFQGAPDYHALTISLA